MAVRPVDFVGADELEHDTSTVNPTARTSIDFRIAWQRIQPRRRKPRRRLPHLETCGVPQGVL